MTGVVSEDVDYLTAIDLISNKIGNEGFQSSMAIRSCYLKIWEMGGNWVTI